MKKKGISLILALAVLCGAGVPVRAAEEAFPAPETGQPAPVGELGLTTAEDSEEDQKQTTGEKGEPSESVLLEPASTELLSGLPKEALALIWDGQSQEEPENEGSIYYIAAPEHLAWLAYMVNEEAESFAETSFLQTADLDLAGHPWTPIGAEGEFFGSYDGDGYEIRGLYVEAEDSWSAGLFGRVGGHGVASAISNVVLIFAEKGVNGSEYGEYTGGLVGYGQNLVLENCHVTGTVRSTTGKTGGLIGYAEGGFFSMTGCTFTGDVLVEAPDTWIEQVGGLAGEVCTNTWDPLWEGTSHNGQILFRGNTFRGGRVEVAVSGVNAVGGIAGQTENGESRQFLEGNDFDGVIQITADYVQNAGGIAGKLYGVLEISENHASGSLILNSEMTEGAGGLLGGMDGPDAYYICREVGEGADKEWLEERVEVYSKVTNGHVSMDLSFAGENLQRIGGIIGSPVNDLWLQDSAFSGKLDVRASENAGYVGGAVGEAGRALFLNEVSVEMDLEIKGEQIEFVGGVLGAATNDTGFIAVNNNAKGTLQADGRYVINTGGFAGAITANVEALLEDCDAEMEISISSELLMMIGGLAGSLHLGVLREPDQYRDKQMYAQAYEEIGGKRYGVLNSYHTASIFLAIKEDGQFAQSIGGLAGQISARISDRTEEDRNGFPVRGSRSDGDITIAVEALEDSVEVSQIGGFAGYVLIETEFESCAQKGDLKIVAPQTAEAGSELLVSDIGGFIGLRDGGPLYPISSSYSIGDIDIRGAADELQVSSVGGFMGTSRQEGAPDQSSALSHCFSNGNVNIDVLTKAVESGSGLSEYHSSIFNVGGFLGYFNPKAVAADTDELLHPVTNSYATGNVTVKAAACDGGDADLLVSAAAGFIGSFGELENEATDGFLPVTNSYYAGCVTVDANEEGIEYTGLFCGNMENYDSDKVLFDNFYVDLERVEHGNVKDQTIPGYRTYEMTRENAAGMSLLDDDIAGLAGFDFSEAGSWVWAENLVGEDETSAVGFYPQLKTFADSSQAAVQADSLRSVGTDAWYFLSLDGDGGEYEGKTSEKGWHLYLAHLDTPAYVKDDVVRIGWKDPQGAKHPVSFELNQDLVLTALYEEEKEPPGGGGGGGNGKTYDVVYHQNHSRDDKTRSTDGGKRSGAVVTVKEGTIFTAPQYQEFAGWAETAGGSVLYQPGETFKMPSRDVNLYAKWEDADGGPRLNYTDHYAYIAGYPDSTVRPEANISREEAASIFFRLLADDSREEYRTGQNQYIDVEQGRWSNIAVSTLTKAGVLRGKGENIFAPGEPLTRAELATIAAQFDRSDVVVTQPFNDVEGHWAESYINRAAALSWVSGYEDGSFRPDDYITRAEVVTLINRVQNRHLESSSDTVSGAVMWPDNPSTAWYYLEITEASNSHYYTRKEDGRVETWTELRPTRDWSQLEKPGTV